MVNALPELAVYWEVDIKVKHSVICASRSIQKLNDSGRGNRNINNVNISGSRMRHIFQLQLVCK